LVYGRYKACWLPLLAKHTQAAVVEGPLAVPLDCEWIWHCHRLNPVHIFITTIHWMELAKHHIRQQLALSSDCLYLRLLYASVLLIKKGNNYPIAYFQVQYIRDCKKVYGRILDNDKVESSTRTTSKLESEKVWTELYPEEPFELDYTSSSDSATNVKSEAAEGITYDLVAAVKRQTSFYYQVFTQSLSSTCSVSISVMQCF
jgi:hypothetical protein